MSEERTYSDDVLDEVEERTTKFLSAVGRTPAIQAGLGTRGWDEAERLRGWSLLHAAASYEKQSGVVGVDPKVAGAQRQLDERDEPTLGIARATLEAEFPEQAAFVFSNLAPAQGPGAIVVFRTFLDRLDALEAGRDGSREQDQAAVALLAKRGIAPTDRQQLRELLGTAEGVLTAAPAALEPDDSERRAALVALKRWYDQWAAIARITIKRRDLLIRLGLASPKRRGGGAPATA